MIIQCPQCQSRFKLPMEKAKTGGTKVRCTKCKSIFFIPSPGGGEKEIDGPKPAQDASDDRSAFYETEQESAPSPESEKEEVDYFGEDFDAAEFFAQKEDESEFFLTGEPASELFPEAGEEDFFPIDSEDAGPVEKSGEFSGEEGPALPEAPGAFPGEEAAMESAPPSLTLAEEEPPPPPMEPSRDTTIPHIPHVPEALPHSARRKPSSAGPVLILLFLLVAAAGGFLLYQQGAVPDYLQPWKKKQAELPSAIDLRLADLTGYHELNVIEGRLFVVRGRVVNHGPEARAGIQVAGIIYDRNGAVIARQNAYCGNPLTRSELRSLTFERMEERMNNQFGEVLSNINIEPNKSVSFMIVFRGVPRNVAEFGVEVIDSKPVAK